MYGSLGRNGRELGYVYLCAGFVYESWLCFVLSNIMMFAIFVWSSVRHAVHVGAVVFLPSDVQYSWFSPSVLSVLQFCIDTSHIAWKCVSFLLLNPETEGNDESWRTLFCYVRLLSWFYIGVLMLLNKGSTYSWFVWCLTWPFFSCYHNDTSF